jgi:hypothetical protein
MPAIEPLFISLTQKLIANAECAKATLSDPTEGEAVADHFLQLIPDVADIRQRCGMSAAEVLSSATGVCGVLQPLFDIGDVGRLNGPSGYRLAELIYPRNAADLTVSQVLALLAQISAEQNGAPLSDYAA